MFVRKLTLLVDTLGWLEELFSPLLHHYEFKSECSCEKRVLKNCGASFLAANCALRSYYRPYFADLYTLLMQDTTISVIDAVSNYYTNITTS